MDKVEYTKQMKRLVSDNDKKIDELNNKYALSNNNVEIGDIVVTGEGVFIRFLEVQKITVREGLIRGEPFCTYTGELLKDDLGKRIGRPIGEVHQPNINKIIKK